MHRKLTTLVSLLLLAATSACGSDKSTTANENSGPVISEDTSPCPAESTLANGSFEFMFDNIKYGYLVHIPPSYDGTQRTPLVLNWHGLGSNAGQQQGFSGMNPVADENGFIVVYPNSPDAVMPSSGGTPSWNAGTCCAVNAMDRDDMGFARALVNSLSQQACINSKRVYTTGMSNGAFMSHRLGCEAADVFAAIAPVAGKVGIPECNPSRPVPVMAFHGTADSLVKYDTGALSGENATVPETEQNWADRDGCKQGPDQTFQNGTVTCQTWSQCNAGVTVTLCTAEGEGHCWPGTGFCPYGAFTTDIDASREIAAFFQKFTLP